MAREIPMPPKAGAELRENGLAIYETDAEGRRTEIVISEESALPLSRALPRLLNAIAAKKLPLGPHHSSAIAVPMGDIQVVPDLLAMTVLVNVKDAAGGDFHYSISPERARKLADMLVRNANKVDERNKATRRN